MIHNVDCLEYLSTLEDNSVDLVLTDPPYYIGFDGGKGWDSQWKTEQEYLDWCDLWSRECVRVLKPNRMLVVFGTLKTDTFIHYKLNTNKIEPLHTQNEIIWSYNWGGRTKSNFARKHEYAWCWSKGEEFLFNADAVRVERKQKINIRTGSVTSHLPRTPWGVILVVSTEQRTT
jgi:DNA modification methylase